MKGSIDMFNMSKLGTGEWFPYQASSVNIESGELTWLPPDPDLDEKVCFKQPATDFMRALIKKYRGKRVNTPVLNPSNKAMEMITTYEDQTAEDEKNYMLEFWDEVITDWTIKDEHKKIIPATAENKYLLLTSEPAFLRYCNRCVALLSGSKIEREKTAEKN